MQTTINLPLIAAVLTALAGVAGSILTPLYGGDLTSAVQGVLQALSALLLVIPTTHASHLAYVSGRARVAARYLPKAAA